LCLLAATGEVIGEKHIVKCFFRVCGSILGVDAYIKILSKTFN
jgi:hypothetical protein